MGGDASRVNCDWHRAVVRGEIVDTNSPFLAGKLAEYGVNLYYISTVGDNLQRGPGVLQRALQRSDLIIMTGASARQTMICHGKWSASPPDVSW